eukprot:924514-Prymnesium_polylepis.1
MRITTATVLSRKGVPMAEITAMLEHSSEEMTRRHIENYDALAIEKRNYSDVIYGSLQQEVVASADEGGISISTIAAITESVAGAVVPAVMDGIAAAVACVPAPVNMGGVAEVGSETEPAPAVGDKRSREDNPQYEKCCKHYKKDTLKVNAIQKDVVLKGLLTMHAQVKPEPMWRLLCSHGYHTFRKEITDY